TATKFARAEQDEDDEGPVALDDREPVTPMRINLPPERPKTAGKASEGPGKPQLRLLPPPDPAGAGGLEPSIEGLPEAAVAAEGVLHARADKEWTLPPIDLLGAGDHGTAGGPSDIQ